MKLIKKIIKIFFLILALCIFFIDMETPYSRCLDRIGDSEPGDCIDAYDDIGTTYRWHLTGNEIRFFSLFKSHGYTECSWFGAEIWIDGYTKDDGTKVSGYSRKRPSCWD